MKQLDDKLVSSTRPFLTLKHIKSRLQKWRFDNGIRILPIFSEKKQAQKTQKQNSQELSSSAKTPVPQQQEQHQLEEQHLHQQENQEQQQQDLPKKKKSGKLSYYKKPKNPLLPRRPYHRPCVEKPLQQKEEELQQILVSPTIATATEAVVTCSGQVVATFGRFESEISKSLHDDDCNNSMFSESISSTCSSSSSSSSLCNSSAPQLSQLPPPQQQQATDISFCGDGNGCSSPSKVVVVDDLTFTYEQRCVWFHPLMDPEQKLNACLFFFSYKLDGENNNKLLLCPSENQHLSRSFCVPMFDQDSNNNDHFSQYFA